VEKFAVSELYRDMGLEVHLTRGSDAHTESEDPNPRRSDLPEIGELDGSLKRRSNCGSSSARVSGFKRRGAVIRRCRVRVNPQREEKDSKGKETAGFVPFGLQSNNLLQNAQNPRQSPLNRTAP